jgi:two-component system, chemotaxis family, chemotaxis protein CheY
MRTLIVEDGFTNRVFLQTFLSRFGECHIAVNGKEAVQAVRQALGEGAPYDLICMDILMPEMNGQEAVKEVRALEEARGIPSQEAVKIIMTTAVTDIQQVMKSFRELCDAYLFKPIDTARLLGELKAFGLVK